MPARARKEPQDFRAKLAAASLPERVVTIYLDGALLAELDQATAELEQAHTPGDDDRFTGNSAARAAARRIEQLQAQMAESQVQIRLRAVPRRRWLGFVAEHPPRDNDEGDTALGVNTATFYDALIRECMIDPQLSDDEYEQLLDALTSKQFDTLADAAWGINRRDVDVPFSGLASVILRNSGETSKPQPAGE